jgi:hypothetical protein
MAPAATLTIADLNLNEDFVAAMDLDQFSTTTGKWADAPGLTGLTLRIAATSEGSAIGTLSASAAEAGSTARYYAIFDKADLTTHLTTFLQQQVYLILSKAGDIDMRWVRYRVVSNAEA